MGSELTRTIETLDQQAEKITMAAVSAAIKCGFDSTGKSKITIRQVVDACAIIVTFLQEAERGPPRTIAEWRAAVENLSVTLGPTEPQP